MKASLKRRIERRPKDSFTHLIEDSSNTFAKLVLSRGIPSFNRRKNKHGRKGVIRL